MPSRYPNVIACLMPIAGRIFSSGKAGMGAGKDEYRDECPSLEDIYEFIVKIWDNAELTDGCAMVSNRRARLAWRYKSKHGSCYGGE